MKKINTIIFGATGSIGKSTLSVIDKNLNKINIEGITCDTNIDKLCEIAQLYKIKKIGFNENSLEINSCANLRKYEVFNSISNFHNIISNKTDLIIFAIGGLAPFDLLLKVLKSGKKVALANKECIISLGSKIKTISNKYNTEIIPLDSEHNSIYHLLKNNLGNYKSITITASGGPFLNFNKRQLNNVTPTEASKHPIWKMGKKISIDSATMMNKALEIIEAKYLFNLKNNEINALIHPQAIIHALINYENGSSSAILNRPDMRIPISSLFFNFNKYSSISNVLDLTKYPKLEFYPINKKKFHSMSLGVQVMKKGGVAPHVFNYLNELLVNLFMKNKIKFTEIVKYNEVNLDKFFNKNSNIANPSLVDIKNINNWIDKNIYIGN